VTVELTELEVAPGGPRVALLSARRPGADEAALKERARAQAAGSGQHTSRSYRYPFALVAWHGEPVGIDLERNGSCGEVFGASICTPSELRSAPEDGARDAYLTSLWCSKEALAKALGDARRYDPRRLGSPIFWPQGQAGPWRAAVLAAPAGHNAWLCWRSTA
jgi:4'-phosphopantetheinyl transferase superfamily